MEKSFAVSIDLPLARSGWVVDRLRKDTQKSVVRTRVFAMLYRVSFVFLLCLIISIIDIKTYAIPDVLLIILGAGILVWDIFYSNRYMIFSSAISALALFGLFFAVFYFVGGLGFGDVKFTAIIGYTLGFQKAVLACLLASLMGILFYSIVFAVTKQDKSKKLHTKIPFAPFLSSGFCSMLGIQTLGVL